MYAMKCYENPQCVSMDEFHSDFNRIKYIKRLLSRYTSTGELKERLILNHIIVLYNVFGIVPATRMLFYKIDGDLHAILKTFIVYLNYLPEGDKEQQVREIDISGITLDQRIVATLRKI
jgi:hypothetical protein